MIVVHPNDIRPDGRLLQKNVVVRELLTVGYISTFEALYNMRGVDGSRYSITRLASIINRMRKMGILILTDVNIHLRDNVTIYFLRSDITTTLEKLPPSWVPKDVRR